jgi:hypothetical protein
VDIRFEAELVDTAAIAAGVETDVIAAVEPLIPGFMDYLAGGYYGPLAVGNAGSSAAPAVGTAHLTPIFISQEQAFDRIACWLVTDAAATGRTRLGIYADNGLGAPGALVVDGGQVATDAGAPAIKEVTIDETLDPGWYWLCAVNQVAVAAATLQRWNASIGSPPMPQIHTAGFVAPTGYTIAAMTGAMPDPAGAATKSAAFLTSVLLRAA